MGGITNILETNIKYLSCSSNNNNAVEQLLRYTNAKQSKYQLNKNKSDEYYLTYENKPITSSYATGKEAARLIDISINNTLYGESVAIFLALSYPAHIKYFSENYKHKNIFIVEKDIELVYLILSSIELEFLSKSILLIDEHADNVAYTIDNLLEDIDVKKVCMCAHPRASAVSNINKEYYYNVANSINEVLKKKVMSLATYYYHAPLWSKNILYNLLNNDGYSVSSILNIAKTNTDMPVLIISAGSSIDTQVQNIRKLSKSHFVLVLSNALGFVVANNIKIDAVISTDGGFYASYHYMALEYAAQNNINIITTYTSYALANAKFNKENIFYFSHNELFEKHFCRSSYYTPMEGSVIIVALKIASLLSTTEIVVAGADFSFTDEKTHSKYSMSFKTDHSLQGKLKSLYSLNENRQGADKTFIDDYRGKQKITNFSLYEYHRHFEYALNNNSRNPIKAKVYSLTDDSAKLDGVSLYKMQDDYKKLEYTIEKVSENIDKNFIRENIKKYFEILNADNSNNFNAILEHEYTMLIAPWHVENFLKTKSDEAQDELISFLKNWSKSISVFL